MKRSPKLERLRSSLLVGVALAIMACALPSTGPDAGLPPELGVLQLESTAPISAAQQPSAAEEWTPSVSDRRHLILPSEVVEVADTVRSRSSFQIVVRTIGVDGCWSADGGELEERGDTLVIQPYDRHSGAAACTMVVMQGGLEHSFSASFDAPGEGIIRVRGRRVRQGDRDFEQPVMVERKVVVIP